MNMKNNSGVKKPTTDEKEKVNESAVEETKPSDVAEDVDAALTEDAVGVDKDTSINEEKPMTGDKTEVDAKNIKKESDGKVASTSEEVRLINLIYWNRNSHRIL